ncbi:uncharacterized protein LOC133711766 [Rosa rugosa]|uniref:uncharacterized protein LOC133711766 n=1 Tax=Rosa rugosa TaxID=74645 RepID=UPI002B4050C4|nr:uncharacterized protein LOC133711766 [Rosa rugosa]
MNAVLCGGPWILAGQTLIVRKWNPDFDPMNEVIGKMALWVRICGLPVKYFKDYTVAKIGKILGDVVKVDQVTIGQARGKFVRGIEVDLSKPLRPYVEVESVAYNVIYEGISLICFECGCFGHSKDKCPTVFDVSPAPPHGDGPNCGNNDQTLAPTENCVMQHEMNTPQSSSSVIKEDMGPWMLMNYRNKKKNDTSGAKKSVSKGSRYKNS